MTTIDDYTVERTRAGSPSGQCDGDDGDVDVTSTLDNVRYSEIVRLAVFRLKSRTWSQCTWWPAEGFRCVIGVFHRQMSAPGPIESKLFTELEFWCDCWLRAFVYGWLTWVNHHKNKWKLLEGITFRLNLSNASFKLNIRRRSLILAARRCAKLATLLYIDFQRTEDVRMNLIGKKTQRI